MKSILRTLSGIAMLGFALSLTACNTIEGAGRDIKGAGEEIEDAADDAKS